MSLRIRAAVRGLLRRRWLSLVVLVLATLCAAAAAIAPMYADAARTAILRNTLAEAPPDGQGMMVVWDQPLEVRPVALDEAREATGVSHAFKRGIRGAEMGSRVVERPEAVKLIARDGSCEKVRVLSGRCPSAPGEVVASKVTSERFGWVVGGTAELEALIPPEDAEDVGEGEAGGPLPLRIVGIYEPDDPHEQHWFGVTYFPDSTGAWYATPRWERLYDPLLTVSGTVEWTREAVSPWQFNVTYLVDMDRLTGADASRLHAAPERVRQDRRFSAATVVTNLKREAGRARLSQATLSVPVAVVAFELVALTWLMLFLAVRDLVRARRQEIALARLRGLSRFQLWRFGLGEPVALLAVGLPLGVLSAIPLVGTLSRSLLGPDIPVSLSLLPWVVAAAAILGGLAAAGLGARSTLKMSITEQWQRSRTSSRRRSWVVDAIVLTLVAAGLVELIFGGLVTEVSEQQATILLVPALIAVASALLAARLLASVCRAILRLTDRRPGIGSFLGLRQIARSPITNSTIVVLVPAFALATFAVSTRAVIAENHRQVATVHVGAPTALVVSPAREPHLIEAVEIADPEGRSAVAVAKFDRSADLIAVDTRRFAHVANWQPGFTDEPLEDLLPQLRPAMAPQVMLTGEAIRVTVDSRAVVDREYQLYVDLEVPDRTGAVTHRLSPMPENRSVRRRLLTPACQSQCELRGFTLETSAVPSLARAQLIIRRVEVFADGEWQEVDAGLSDSSRWRGLGESERVQADTVGSPEGLRINFLTGDNVQAITNTHPELLPAITVGDVGKPPVGHQVAGLDGVLQEDVNSIAAARALPGADSAAALVDFEMAERAAFGVTSKVEHQVWLSEEADGAIRSRLEETGAPIVAEETVTGLQQRFNSEGPGLAMGLLLATAVAGAALALGRGIVGLYVSGRERSYEYAVLRALGATPSGQRSALIIEQAIVLGAGVVVGTAAGLTSAMISLPRTPQFVTTPIVPELVYELDLVSLGAWLAVALAAIALAVIAATEALRGSARAERLRETAP